MNLEVLRAARQSVIDDPEFNMNKWDHCLAGHICKVSGIPVVYDVVDGDRRYHTIVNGEKADVAHTASNLVGLPVFEMMPLFVFGVFGKQNKLRFLYMLDCFIARQPIPARYDLREAMRELLQPEQPEPDQELVCA